MIDVLKRLMAESDPESMFHLAALFARVRSELDRALDGGLTRIEFERRLFTFGEMSRLPIGHLFDHRVQMPEQQARALLNGDANPLTELLSNMLCSTHAQGAELIAEALKLNPEADARNLLETMHSFPEFAIKCLSGWHHTVQTLPASAELNDRAKLKRIYYSTALYFGALQLQIISVRQRAIEEFHFQNQDGRKRHTIGAHDAQTRQMVSTLKAARDAIFSETKPKGARPKLFRLLKAEGEIVESKVYLARGPNAKLEAEQEVRHLFASLSPRIELMHSVYSRARQSSSLGEKGRNSSQLRSEMRTRITTVVAGGVTGGQQIAYASLRLLAFSRQLQKIETGTKPWPRRHDQWFSTLAGCQNKDVAKLVLVNRSAVWITAQDPSAFGPNGVPYDLRSTLALNMNKGKTPSEELLWETKLKAANWSETQSGVTVDQYFVGAQMWDIYPEFHLGTAGPPTTAVDGKLVPNKGWEIGPHTPSPQYRAPRKSHRHF